MASALEAPLTSAASAVGDRGARVAAAEALAGVLASPHVDAPWAAPLLLKTVAESAAGEAEEWLRAVRYAARGEAPGEGSDDVLRGVLATDGVLSSSSTTAREARRLEAALACVSPLVSGVPNAGTTRARTLAGLAFQEVLVDELSGNKTTVPVMLNVTTISYESCLANRSAACLDPCAAVSSRAGRLAWPLRSGSPLKVCAWRRSSFPMRAFVIQWLLLQASRTVGSRPEIGMG